MVNNIKDHGEYYVIDAELMARIKAALASGDDMALEVIAELDQLFGPDEEAHDGTKTKAKSV